MCVCWEGDYLDFFFHSTNQIVNYSHTVEMTSTCDSLQIWKCDVKYWWERRRRLAMIMTQGCSVHARPVASAVTYHALLVVNGTGVVSVNHPTVKRRRLKKWGKDKSTKNMQYIVWPAGGSQSWLQKIDWLSIWKETVYFFVCKSVQIKMIWKALMYIFWY